MYIICACKDNGIYVSEMVTCLMAMYTSSTQAFGLKNWLLLYTYLHAGMTKKLTIVTKDEVQQF